MEHPIIEAHELTHSFRTFERGDGLLHLFRDLFARQHRVTTALKGVSFSIERGEMIGILGANGAGKTTLMKILSGLVHPSSGTVQVLDHTPHRKEPGYLRRVGVVLGQKSQLQWDLPALDTLSLLRCMYRVPREDFQKRLSRFTALLDVEKKLHVPVRSLSLGERMKFELMAALIHRPEILFLDEPTIGLDVMSQRSVRAFLQQVRDEHKTTILITSHNMRDIEDLSDRVLLFKEGSLLFSGTPHQLLHSVSDAQRIYFTAREPLSLPNLEHQTHSSGEYSVTCSRKNLATTIEKLQVAGPQSIRVEGPSLEDAMVALLGESP